MNQFNINIQQFRFHHKEALFLQRHIWDKFNDRQKPLVDRVRLMVADLSMNKELALGYHVESLDLPVSFYQFSCEEIFSFNVAGKDSVSEQKAMVVHISTNRDHFKFRPQSLGSMEKVSEAIMGFEKEHKGRRYIIDPRNSLESLLVGTETFANADVQLPAVDLNYITNNLRHFIQAAGSDAQGVAQVWDDHLSIYLELANQSGDDFYIHIALATPNS